MTHSTTPPAPQTSAAEQNDLIERFWQSLLDKDDRNSPEEYPDMAMLTFDEFAGYIREVADPHAAQIAALTEALAVAQQRIAELENSLDWFADNKGDGAQVEAYAVLEGRINDGRLAAQISIMRHALAELGKEAWQRCPSTHCERSQECRSPNECSAVGKHLAQRALDAAFRIAVGDPALARIDATQG